MRRKLIWMLFVAIAVLAAYAGNVLATPPTTPGFSGTTLARATFGELDINAHTNPADVWKAQLKTNGDSDLYVQQNTWDPSACNGCIPSSGWHTHPGPSLVIVTQGTVTAYDGDDPTCTPHVYSADGTTSAAEPSTSSETRAAPWRRRSSSNSSRRTPLDGSTRVRLPATARSEAHQTGGRHRRPPTLWPRRSRITIGPPPGGSGSRGSHVARGGSAGSL
jgi:hypothetical protein